MNTREVQPALPLHGQGLRPGQAGALVGTVHGARPVRRRLLPAPSPAVSPWLGYGLAVVPAIAALVPFGIGTGTQSKIVAALAFSMVLLGCWLIRFVLARSLVLVKTPLNAPAAVFGLVWIIACLTSNAFFDPRVAVRLGTAFAAVQAAAVTVTLVSLGLLLLGADVGRDPRYAWLATWGLFGIGGVAILAYYLNREGRLHFVNTNGLFTLWVVALSYGQALFNERLRLPIRLGLIGLAAAFVVKTAIYQTSWLSGWMPPVVALALITLLRSRLLALVGLLGATAVGFRIQDRLYEAVFQANLDEGSETRLEIWSQAWDLLSQHPILGTGPAGYAAYYMTLYVGSGASMSTHSNYVDIAAQTGIVGSVVFIWLLIALAVVAWRACRRWQSGFEGGYAYGAAGGLLGVVVAMALGDWAIPFVYNQGINGFRYTVHSWVFLGLLAGLACRPREAEGG